MTIAASTTAFSIIDIPPPGLGSETGRSPPEVFMTVRWQPVAAVTASGLLRAELRIVEQHARWKFEYTESIPDARRFAHHRPMIIVGADLVARVHTPIACGGIVMIAATDVTDSQAFTHAERIGAAYVIFLPLARRWLIDLLLQSHRWCGTPAPHPSARRQPPNGNWR
jgi:hypothetical protein